MLLFYYYVFCYYYYFFFFFHTWTRARSTWNVHTDPRIAIICLNASITIVPSSIISAIDTRTSLGITTFSMTIALTSLTMREIPKARFTLTACSSISIRSTFASSCFNIAEIVQRSYTIAVTRYTTLWTKTISSRRATITAPTNDVWFTRTNTSVTPTKQTVGSSWITFTSWNMKIMINDSILI